jgi:8-oxo-dGTP diphosphatase
LALPRRKRRRGVTVRARCIIRDGDGRILVQWDPMRNAYTLPGGRVEFEESIAICLLREMKEEAGIDVKPVRLTHVVELVESKPPFHEIIFYFECEYSGTPKSVNRYVKLEWRRIEEIKDKFWPRPLAEKLGDPGDATVYYIAIVDGSVSFVLPVARGEGRRS